MYVVGLVFVYMNGGRYVDGINDGLFDGHLGSCDPKRQSNGNTASGDLVEIIFAFVVHRGSNEPFDWIIIILY